ncbi:MAG: hypothetical protein Ct9H300mP12_10740 [Acidimicrobiales bacterium]|nr:MAG: hypothetical protein Ct9H300mP12_10740 [Acidimicrobiales bacterium]
MSGPLEGIRVVEMASWMFVPSAASVLVDWGADVLKGESPDGGDPQRGLISSGLLPGGAGGVNFMVEQPNRGKRSLAINVADPDGHEAFMKVIETADVFLNPNICPRSGAAGNRRRRPPGPEPRPHNCARFWPGTEGP